MFCLFFVSGGVYLSSINQTAVEGYRVRSIEKEVADLEKQGAELKIHEADLRSLANIEGASQDLSMRKLDANVIYLEERGPVALR